MIFGNKREFSIEVVANKIQEDYQLFGYVHLYIRNKRIGYFRFIDMLCDIMLSFEGIYRMKNMRLYEELFYLDKDDLFTVIWFAHRFQVPQHLRPMVEHFFPRSEDIDIYDDRVPMDFNFFPEVDTFRQWCGFLISSGKLDKLVYGYQPDIIGYNENEDTFYLRKNFSEKIKVLTLERGIFDSVVKEAVAYFHKQYSLAKI